MTIGVTVAVAGEGWQAASPITVIARRVSILTLSRPHPDEAISTSDWEIVSLRSQ